MTSRWFRIYDEVLDDPKVQRLSPILFRTWINVLCAASRRNGMIPSVDELAFMLRCDATLLAEQLDDLAASGLIDDGDDGATPHNWNGRQFQSDTSTERVKRFRNKPRNVSAAPPVTPPETEADTEPETESRPSDEKRAHEPDPADDPLEIPVVLRRDPESVGHKREFSETFWPEYPHKVGKPAAEKAFLRVRKTVDLGTIMAGLRAYVHEKPPDRSWLNPATFLNQERFNDQPAEPPSPNGKSRPHDAIFAALAEAATRGNGHDERPPDADDGLRDIGGGAPGDSERDLTLPPTDYRRTG